MDKEVRGRRGMAAKVAAAALLIALVVVLVFLYPSLSSWMAAERSVPLARLRLAEVSRGDLLRDVSVQGRVVAADHPTLVSPAQGVASILVKAGDTVPRGRVMAHIESPELQNLVEQERSTLLSMRSALDRLRIANHQADLQNQQEVALFEVKLRASQRALERARSLFEEGLGSSIDYQKAQDDVEVARLELSHARENVRLAKETMDFEIQTRELELQRQQLVLSDLERKIRELAVVSPVAGLVSKVEVKDKDTVQPNQALFSVVDLSEFEVEVLIPENYADEIALETPAVIHYEGREYQGRVKSLSPEVENSQVKGIVAFGEVAPSGLKQNQRVSTRLVLDSRKDVIKIPRGPFLESLGGHQVYVVEGSLATLRTISVGAVSVTEVEIQSGLQPGEKIVLSDLTRFQGARTILLRN